MNKAYTRINWINYPSTNTPINDSNLNAVDAALDAVDDRVIALDTNKATKTEISSDIVDWTINTTTGVITATYRDGSTVTFDLNIEKIPVTFSLSAQGILTMTTADGTVFTADIGALIPILAVQNTDTIVGTATTANGTTTIEMSVKAHSIGADQLETDYLATINVAVATAQASATQSTNNAALSRNWAVGSSTVGDPSDTNNSKYWSERSEYWATQSSVPIATTATAGRVKPDGTTITVDVDGTIRATGAQIEQTTGTSTTSVMSQNAVTTALSNKADLDANGRIPYSQLPESAMEYKGEWNANTNTPTLTDGTGDVGDFYIVSVAGTSLGQTFAVNDRVIYNGSTWDKLAGGAVESVNGRTGAVTLTKADVGITIISNQSMSTATVTVSDSSITLSSLIDVYYADNYDISPTYTQANGSLTITLASAPSDTIYFSLKVVN